MVQEVGMVSADGRRIALKSVHIEGRVDGLLADIEMTQHYRNDSGRNLEIVYTFPLAWGATLVGMEVVTAAGRLRAAIMGRAEAQQQYERAIEAGDAPILVEQSAPGLYTTNLGNIGAGEKVSVTLRYAQLLSCERGSFTLRIPCTIAPRYGDQYLAGGLAPHENAAADTLIEYPLSLNILLQGMLARAAVYCPSHPCRIENTVAGVAVALAPGARLDRDCIFTISGLQQSSFALTGPDLDDHSLVLAGFHPVFPPSASKRLCLKILADCSGSMAGDSIESLKKALAALPALFMGEDRISYSRFGSEVQLETPGFLTWSSDRGERKRLVDAFSRTKADMGGTEMERALLATLNDIPLPEGGPLVPCVLLITDGAVWDVDAIIRAACSSKERIFAIGVGSAPAESLLRQLALQTGGACAFVSPNEDIFPPLRNMVDKMRGPETDSLRVEWGHTPAWQSALPLNLYDGDTVYVFASFTGSAAPRTAPVLRWRSDGEERELPAGIPDLIESDTIARLAGAARLEAAATPEEARSLALRYQLLSQHTALFLIHEREGEKGMEFPALHQVPQMMAAGHGGFGSVRDRRRYAVVEDLGAPDGPSARGLGAGPYVPPVDADETTVFIKEAAARLASSRPALSPLGLLRDFEARAAEGVHGISQLERVFDALRLNGPERVFAAISAWVHMGEDVVGVLFLDWLRQHLADVYTMPEQTLSALQHLLACLGCMAKVRAERVGVAKALFARIFADIGPDSWERREKGEEPGAKLANDASCFFSRTD